MPLLHFSISWPINHLNQFIKLAYDSAKNFSTFSLSIANWSTSLPFFLFSLLLPDDSLLEPLPSYIYETTKTIHNYHYTNIIFQNSYFNYKKNYILKHWRLSADLILHKLNIFAFIAIWWLNNQSRCKFVWLQNICYG